MTKIDELMKLFDEAAEASFDQGLHQRTVDDAPEAKREVFKKALETALKAVEPVSQRALDTSVRQWEHWKQYALELQERLVKYEGGSPMVLNAAPPAQPDALKAAEPACVVGSHWNSGGGFDVHSFTSPPPPTGTKLYATAHHAQPDALKPGLPVVGYINEMDEPVLTKDTRRIDLACSGGCTRLYGDAQ